MKKDRPSEFSFQNTVEPKAGVYVYTAKNYAYCRKNYVYCRESKN